MSSSFKCSPAFSRALSSILHQQTQYQHHLSPPNVEVELKVIFNDETTKTIRKLLKSNAIHLKQHVLISDIYYDLQGDNRDYFLSRHHVWIRRRVCELMNDSVEGSGSLKPRKTTYDIKVGVDLGEGTESDDAYVTRMFESSDEETVLQILRSCVEHSWQEVEGAQKETAHESNSHEVTHEQLSQLLQDEYTTLIAYDTDRESYVSQCGQFRIDLDRTGTYRVGEVECLTEESTIEDLLQFCERSGLQYASQESESLKSKVEILSKEQNPGLCKVMRERYALDLAQRGKSGAIR